MLRIFVEEVASIIHLNQLAKEAKRDKFVSIVDGFFAEGLFMLVQFVDIDQANHIIFYKFVEKHI